MAQVPDSPDEVIDARWISYLRPARGARRALPAQPASTMSSPELSVHMRAILARWEAGEHDARETLEALRQLAERAL